MATVRKEIVVNASAGQAWDAIRDVGSIHTRLARGFVTSTDLQGDRRLVTFASGAVAREQIVTVDDEAMRLAYSVVEGRPTHHNASIQVFDDCGGRSRVVWIADFLPDEIAGYIDAMMEQGTAAMTETLERS